MSLTGLAPIDSTVHTTNEWFHDINKIMGWKERPQAYHALRAVLHALRDRLSVEQVAALGAQLPLLVRGIYYEGWHPHGKPLKERKREEFLAHIAKAYRTEPAVDAEEVTRAIFHLLRQRLSAGQVATIISVLPTDIQELWF